MEHNEHNTNIKEAILGKIRTKELHMHPKYYFWLRIIAIAFVSFAALLISIFILNFILFSIRINSDDALFFMGPRGWGAFFYFFPWRLLALDALLMMALLWLLRQFRFGYRSPLLYMLLGLFFLTFAAGFLIDRTTDINERFLRADDRHGLPPPFDGVYRGVRHDRPVFFYTEIKQPPQAY